MPSSLQDLINKRKEKGLYNRICVQCGHPFLNEYTQSHTKCIPCYSNNCCNLRRKRKRKLVQERNHLIDKRIKKGQYFKHCIRCNTVFQNNNRKSRVYCKQCSSQNVMYDRQRDTLCVMCFEPRTPSEFTGHPVICNWCLINQRRL